MNPLPPIMKYLEVNFSRAINGHSVKHFATLSNEKVR